MPCRNEGKWTFEKFLCTTTSRVTTAFHRGRRNCLLSRDDRTQTRFRHLWNDRSKGFAMKRLMLALISLPLGAAAPSGADIAMHGTSHGALPCMACHGAAFQGNPSIGAPPLASQPSTTTLAALDAIATGKLGTNTVMQNIAASLTPAERAAVASYFASLKAK
jgi:cytochrome c553